MLLGEGGGWCQQLGPGAEMNSSNEAGCDVERIPGAGTKEKRSQGLLLK